MIELKMAMILALIIVFSGIYKGHLNHLESMSRIECNQATAKGES